jgi:hypothetical protein
MEHNTYANDQLIATKSIDNQQHDLDKAMASFHQLMPLVVAVTCLGMAEKLTLAFIERDVEKALGRPLSSYDRVLLRKEYERKQACSWLVALFEAYDQRCRDDEVIRWVVWRWG